jgi:hypothetical protein
MPKSMRKRSMRKKHHRSTSQNKALQQLFERFKKLSKRVKYSKYFKK